MSERAALISVSDRTGLVPFAKELQSLGFKLLATSGSGKALVEAGCEVVAIEQYTGQAEILDGRVKTLHPKIHAGLLAKRGKPEHLAQLDSAGIWPIDIAVVNLYPFIEQVRSAAAQSPEKMIEFIDIGGPTMIRAAAKNCAGVLAVIDPADYPAVVEFLKVGSAKGMKEQQFRAYLASKVFTAIARYDMEIARYISLVAESPEGTPNLESFAETEGLILERSQALRYGENPAQKAALYRSSGTSATGASAAWTQHQGKELSYNNMLDLDATSRLLESVRGAKPTAVIIKHANPCGVATGNSLLDALQKAKLCDPRSHFGGILGFSEEVTAEVAANIREDFAEVVLAPSYSEEALKVLGTAKNLRVISYSKGAIAKFEVRSVLDSYLIQTPDTTTSDVKTLPVVTKVSPDAKQIEDLDLAWRVCANVKSNAIVIAKDGMIVGVGAGQMSRIDSVELAISKAQRHGHTLKGAVAASDAFFPFPDNVETLAAIGVSAIVVPSGAKKDEEVIQTADRLGIAILFAPERHFRH